jgi:hypothetical protein
MGAADRNTGGGGGGGGGSGAMVSSIGATISSSEELDALDFLEDLELFNLLFASAHTEEEREKSETATMESFMVFNQECSSLAIAESCAETMIS